MDGFPFVGNHAYLWDNSTFTAEAMRGSSKSGMESNNELGPTLRSDSQTGVDDCALIDGSEGKEKQIMNYMRKNQNDGIWFPWLNDCHEAIDDTVEHFGLENPGAPGGRFGPPQE